MCHRHARLYIVHIYQKPITCVKGGIMDGDYPVNTYSSPENGLRTAFKVIGSPGFAW